MSETGSIVDTSRVLLKLSGEALGGSEGFGLNAGVLSTLADKVSAVRETGRKVAVVVGGGNFFRGTFQGASIGIDRVPADQMGMLATVINGKAVQETLRLRDIPCSAFSPITVSNVMNVYKRDDALQSLDSDEVVVLAGGTGNPYFTTDTAAVLRALELKCTCLLKGTQVDGIYDSDPKTNPSAQRFDSITYSETMDRGLAVMDLAAIALAKDNSLPIKVFNFAEENSVLRAIEGDIPSTTVLA